MWLCTLAYYRPLGLLRGCGDKLNGVRGCQLHLHWYPALHLGKNPLERATPSY